jgi:hypothetical protein
VRSQTLKLKAEGETMKKALETLFAASRRLLKQWRVMAVMAAIYASLLAVLYLFVTTKEATRWQVMLTLVFAALAPALFFLLQTVIVNYAHGEAIASELIRRSFRDSCKLALASIPLALLIFIFFYLLHQTSAIELPFSRFRPEASPAMELPASSTGQATALSWPELTLATLRLLVFAVVLPLGAIHLWGATLSDGLLAAFKKLPRNLARTFAPQTALVYAGGLVLFGLIPYLLLFTRTPASNAWVEFSLFVARLFLVFVFTLYGWALTINALAGVRGDAKGPESV